MTQKTNQNPWQFDVRVRERNLKQGSLTDKELEKHLAGLPDLESQTESFGTSQPALEQPRIGTHLAPGLPLAVNGSYRPAVPAPELGDHTVALLRDRLGLSAEEIDRLARAGTVS